jgi:hypothetical protein
LKGGWVTLPRRFFDSAAWKENRKLSRAEAVLDLYQRAQWDAGEIFVRGKLIQLARGEQAASCRFLAERWGWTKDTVARFLKTMESEASGNRANSATANGLLIRSEMRQGETVLILCNYDEWTLAGMTGCDTATPDLDTTTAPPIGTGTSQGRDKAKEGEEDKESNDEDGHPAGKSSAPPAPPSAQPTEASQAERLIAACPSPGSTRPALEAAVACLRRHPGRFEEILAGTRAASAASAAIAAWPEDERTTYRPGALKFFQDDLWATPADQWASRRDARKRLAADKLPPKIDIGWRRYTVLDISTAPAGEIELDDEPTF